MSTLVFEAKIPPTGNPQAILGQAAALFGAHGQRFDARLNTERMRGRPGVNRRSGHLAQGWNVQTMTSGSGVVTTNWLSGPAAEQDGRHGYGWIQEHGATIRPVKSRFLWIPTKENQTPTGVARITPREAIAAGGFIHNGVFFGKTLFKSQRPSGMTIKGTRGLKGHTFAGREPIVPLFVLKTSVVVPPRLGATNLWNSMTPDLERGIDQIVKAAI